MNLTLFDNRTFLDWANQRTKLLQWHYGDVPIRTETSGTLI